MTSARPGAPSSARSGIETLTAGAAAGLIGGVFMAAVTLVVAAGDGVGLLFPLRVVGTTLDGERALLGPAMGPLDAVVAHVIWATVLGVVFAALLGRYTRPLSAAAAGIAFAAFVYFVTVVVLLPYVDPEAAQLRRAVKSSWLLGHAAFGIGVSAAPALRRRLVARRAARP